MAHRLDAVALTGVSPLDLDWKAPARDVPFELLTVGEHAHLILVAIDVFLSIPDEDRPPAHTNGKYVGAAIDLLRSCFAMMDQFPMQSRLSFSKALPFSRLEQQLMRRVQLQEDDIGTEITARIINWAVQSPVVADEENVHVADFLRELEPCLDRWEERQYVAQAVKRQYQ